jgi:lactate racemase
MQIVELKYGKSKIPIQLADHLLLKWIQPNHVPGIINQSAIVEASITHPLEGIHLPKMDQIQKVAIAINDKTRPVPHWYLLPPLLKFLHTQGLKNEQIQFIIATGTHKPMPAAEYPLILQEDIYANYVVESHDCDSPDLISLGKTSFSTDVEINRSFFESDLKIMVGNIEPHHFMGFSGGNKTASIGLTGRNTINHNHSFLTSDLAKTGEYDQNPCRLDVEEIGQLIGAHAALNAILSTDKQIVHCLFGDPVDVIQAGIQLSREICQVQVEKKYQIVIASAGGYPKDINLYQAQKAITNAAAITEDGGWIYLLAECSEGPGSSLLLDFMKDVNSPDEAIHKFQSEEFRIGPHKAFQLAKQAKRVHIGLVSSMDSSTCEQFFCTPINVDNFSTFPKLNSLECEVAIMPDAVATIPHLLSKVS